MNDVTVIYATSNREDEAFERRIQIRLLSCIGTLPLITVSQKPLPRFGENICVGDVGASQHNLTRQRLIAAQQARTRFVLQAEDDFVYQDGYFRLPPNVSDDAVYYYQPVYLFYSSGGLFRRKQRSEGAMLCSRELLIRKSIKELDGRDEWTTRIAKKKPQPFRRYDNADYVSFSGQPCASIKTDNGLHKSCRLKQGYIELHRPEWPLETATLNGIGHVDALREELLGA